MKIANIIETALNKLEKNKKAEKSTPNIDVIDTTVVLKREYIGGISL